MESADEDDLAIRTSKLKQVKFASSFIEFREFIQDDTPCVLSQDSIYSFQDILDESWLREHAGKSQVCLRKSPTGRFIDPSDSILQIAKSLSGKKIMLNEFLNLKESRTMLSGTDTYIFTKDSVVEQWSELWAHAQEVLHEHGGEKSLISRSRLSTVGFWLSRGGIQSITHYDNSISLL